LHADMCDDDWVEKPIPGWSAELDEVRNLDMEFGAKHVGDRKPVERFLGEAPAFGGLELSAEYLGLAVALQMMVQRGRGDPDSVGFSLRRRDHAQDVSKKIIARIVAVLKDEGRVEVVFPRVDLT